jgi:phosphopantothenoylcysteine synthetase/decarboxylase
VVVIGGASREPLDAVRSLTNESSGASAIALATQAHFRGANVALWLGALEVVVPSFLTPKRWGSVEDLLVLARQERELLAAADAVIVPAALSDYTVEPRPGKISSREHATLSLTLRRAPKVLPELRSLAPRPTRLVAFKLLAGEGPERLATEGQRLREETGADWVVANDAATMGSPTTEALVLDPKGDRHWIRGPKPEFAGRLLDELGRELTTLRATSGPSPVTEVRTSVPHRRRGVRADARAGSRARRDRRP